MKVSDVSRPWMLWRGACVRVMWGTITILSASVMGGWAADTNPWMAGKYGSFSPSRTGPQAQDRGIVQRSIAPSVKLGDSFVYRPRLSPGDSASLRAEYSVTASAGSVEVKETRTITFDGLVVATLERVVTRASGVVGSEYQLRIPRDAAEGWYSVTTIIEPLSTTRGPATPPGGSTGDTAFYIEARGNGSAKPGTAPSPPESQGGDSAISVKLAADRRRYKVGESLTVKFETSRDGYLTLVNVGSSGRITILYPNRLSGGNEVKAGKVYLIPERNDEFDLAISGPPGVELIYALLTLRPVQFLESDFSKSGGTFQVLTDKLEVFTRDINAVARQTPVKERARAVLELDVVP